MNEIKEIKEYLMALEANTDWEVPNAIYRQHIRTLLSSLETKDKEKEQSEYFRLEVNRLTDKLGKEKERADKLQGELNHVDMVLARRSALDDIPDRIGKILHALKRAKELEEKIRDIEEVL